MSTYRVWTGHSVALGLLAVLSPQPRSEGVKATKRDFVGDGSYVEQGLYCELVYDVLEDAAAYQAILTTFGLSVATSALVTLYARDEQYIWRRYNGRAIRPGVGNGVVWQNYFIRNATILVRDLVLQA